MRKISKEVRTKDLLLTIFGATSEIRGLLNKLINRNTYNRRLSKAQLKNLSARAHLKEFAELSDLFTDEELKNL